VKINHEDLRSLAAAVDEIDEAISGQFDLKRAEIYVKLDGKSLLLTHDGRAWSIEMPDQS